MHFGCGMSIFSLIKGDFGGLLVSANVLVESTVGVVLLLLDSSTELEQSLGHFLLGGLQNVDQTVLRQWEKVFEILETVAALQECPSKKITYPPESALSCSVNNVIA